MKKNVWNKGLKGIHLNPSTEFKKGMKPWNLGKKWNNESKEKMRLAKLGKKDQETNRWMGDKVKYRALHSWVIRKLGKASKCTFCNQYKTTPKSIHWANRSQEYKRDLNDWIQLCAKCHKAYDKDKIKKWSLIQAVQPIQ